MNMVAGDRPLGKWRDALFALVLLAPVLVLYTAHFGAVLLDPTHIGTGFIYGDTPEYMASAREYIDGSHTFWMYAQPSTPDYNEQPTLVQVHLLALSWLLRLTAMDPGWLFVCYGMLAAFMAIRVFMAVFDHMVPMTGPGRRIGQFLFVWGGGMLALAGAAVAASDGYHGIDVLKQSLCIDPASGIWGLNLGRILILPNEALYHAMFFGALLLGLQGRWSATLILAIVLMWCHPFAGTELLAVLGAWSAVELLVIRAGKVPMWFAAALVAAALPYLWYLLIWIPGNADPLLVSAIRTNFTIPWYSSVCAYVIVGSAAAARMVRGGGASALRSDVRLRALVVMFAVCLFLENHELFTSAPHQPAHFSRGYVWSALFLLGAPWVAAELKQRVRPTLRKGARLLAIGACIFFCIDNLAFFTLMSGSQLHARYTGSWYSPDAWEVLTLLDDKVEGRPLVVSDDNSFSQLVGVYTPLRSYYGHAVEEQRLVWKPRQQAFFKGRITDPRLAQELIVVATKADQPDFVPIGDGRILLENGTYRVWYVPAQPKGS